MKCCYGASEWSVPIATILSRWRLSFVEDYEDKPSAKTMHFWRESCRGMIQGNNDFDIGYVDRREGVSSAGTSVLTNAVAVSLSLYRSARMKVVMASE